MKTIIRALLRSLAALSVVILLTVITANAQHYFAIWYDADVEKEWVGEDIYIVNENATLTVLGFEHIPPTERVGARVDIMVNIHGDAELPWHYDGNNYRLQYYQDGKWYVVGHPLAVPAVGANWMPAGDTVMRYRVPLTVLQQSGTFRLYVYPLGFCDVPGLNDTDGC
ncbi:hypothetical protein AALD01_00885 [Oscillospiraceae bacterium 21-37]|nr:hypothetical protein [Acutalibacter sp.]